MVKLVALYKPPAEPQAFDQHYFGTHLPLVEKWPGLKKVEISRITGAPVGKAPYYLMCEMYFDSQEEMEAALASEEGKAAARDLFSFAGELVVMFFADSEVREIG